MEQLQAEAQLEPIEQVIEVAGFAVVLAKQLYSQWAQQLVHCLLKLSAITEPTEFVQK